MGRDDEDADDLFRRAMQSQGVSPVDYGGDRVTTPRKPGGRGRSHRSTRPGVVVDTNPPAAAVIDQTDSGDTIRFVRAGVARARYKALFRGKVPIEDRIDLHGLRAHEVEPLLDRFLAESIGEGIEAFLLIHGKGHRSPVRGGVIPPIAIHWLRRQAAVMAFCEALPADGGRGALYVLLGRPGTRRREPDET